MPLRGNNFHHSHIVGLALAPQSVGQATVNGVSIVEPWTKGKQLSFIINGGVHGAAAAATLKVQGLKRSDGTTWEALKDNTGADLAFTAAKLADTAELETAGYLLGTLPLDEIAADTYSAVRLTYAQATGSITVLIGASYVISELYSRPGGAVDDLFAKLVP